MAVAAVVESDEELLTTAAATMHAATAAFVERAVAFDDAGGWHGVGMLSCAHWLSINCGLELWTASAMLQSGHALRALPKIADAFRRGRLSFDKVRALAPVARPEDEETWLEIGLQGSGAQVGRICRAFRRVMETDDPDRAAAQRRKRRLVTWWRDDGMLEIYASLPPEDGAIVLNALRAAVKRSIANGEDSARPPADQPVAGRRADALTAICESSLLAPGQADGSATGAARSLIVHVDADVLVDPSREGRCHAEDGPALPAAVARRLGCDADVLAVVERDGEPVAVGCNRRLVTGRLRRLLQIRDQTCRYPGCTVPARDTHAHHVHHWIDGGKTELANLLSLCRFHHHRHHDGEFDIVRCDGGFQFVTAAGVPIGAPQMLVPGGLADATADGVADVNTSTPVMANDPVALDGGRAMDLEHTLWVLGGRRDVAGTGDAPSP